MYQSTRLEYATCEIMFEGHIELCVDYGNGKKYILDNVDCEKYAYVKKYMLDELQHSEFKFYCISKYT